jgi:hypothetical protein
MIRINVALKPCKWCTDEKRMWFKHVGYYAGIYGAETIIPKWLKCLWCGRLVDYTEIWERAHASNA